VKGKVTPVFINTQMWLYEGMNVLIFANKFCNWYDQPTPVEIMMHQKQLEHVDYFQYLNSMISNDARSTRKINSRVSIAKAAFSKKKARFSPAN